MSTTTTVGPDTPPPVPTMNPTMQFLLSLGRRNESDRRPGLAPPPQLGAINYNAPMTFGPEGQIGPTPRLPAPGSRQPLISNAARDRAIGYGFG
jgi:hypothetical protein